LETREELLLSLTFSGFLLLLGFDGVFSDSGRTKPFFHSLREREWKSVAKQSLLEPLGRVKKGERGSRKRTWESKAKEDEGKRVKNYVCTMTMHLVGNQ
jgi:hypothetical protein